MRYKNPHEEFPDETTGIKVARLEADMRHLARDVDEIKGELKAMDGKLDDLILEVKRKTPSVPPSPRKQAMVQAGQQGLLATLLAVVLWLLQTFAGMPASVVPRTAPVEQTSGN